MPICSMTGLSFCASSAFPISGAETLPRNEERSAASSYLPEAFATDPDRLARFQREAQVLASLNHPGIAAIYGIEEAEGTRALVLELVEGPTLADRIAHGAIPVDEALPIAKQIAEAVEAAHEAGVIHRDLKPANIKVREDGTVKVLDFGLAKALAGDVSGTDLSQSPTVTASGTREGVILGTAAYMSPEQARGKLLDRRTDIWSFGCVLYEILTRRSPFLGETLSDTIAKVLGHEPDWQALPTNTPALLRRLLRRCLNKDSKERLRDIGDARVEIRQAVTAPLAEDVAGTLPASPQAAGWRQALPLVVGVSAVAVVITGLAVWSLTRPAALPAAPTMRFDVTSPAQPLALSGQAHDIAISPDGLYAVYRGADALHVRRFDQLAGTPLPGTEQGFSPFISPDGASVGFYDVATTGLSRVSIHEGTVERITGTPPLRGASWGSDNTIVFSTNSGGLWRVSANGGEPEILTSPENYRLNHEWPHFLPGGQAVLFTISQYSSIDTARIAVLDLDSGEKTVLLEDGTSPRYVSTGHVVYASNGTLRAAPFSLDRLAVTGNAVQVLEGVVTKTRGAADFSVASDGSLLYVAGTTQQQGYHLVWVDHQGKEEALPVPPGSIVHRACHQTAHRLSWRWVSRMPVTSGSRTSRGGRGRG